jgi:molybdate transport system ATP-binding protein
MNSSKSESRPPFLSLRNAAFRLGDELAFENTSWVMRLGEQWAILGPNGSGKSMLVDALRGILPIVRGELSYHFHPPDGATHEFAIGHVSFEGRKSGVRGLVVQSRWNSIEESDALSVSDFLSFERVMEINPFEVTGRNSEARLQFERRRRHALGLLRVRPFLDRTLISLSNGETQRVQLARALCLPLRLLILDEPFMGLDAATRAWFHRVLERLMSTPLRVLLIVTRMEDLPDHVTHLLFVDRCEVVAAGPRRAVLRAMKGRGALHRRAVTRETVGAEWQRRLARKHRLVPRRISPAELVRLSDVTVRYGNSVLLREVSWTIYSGESWALLGPNGSGKTTLLSLILGDNPQVYGNDVAVFGKRRGGGESVWEIKSRIGWVSADLQLYWTDASDCMAVVISGFHDSVGLFHKTTARQRKAARERLARLGLLAFAGVPFVTLSAGQQRLVLLARALVKKPRLLILDEPCQGLDGGHREVMLQAVETLIKNGDVTVIFVTHRADEIPGAIMRALHLNAGRAAELTRFAQSEPIPRRPN